jgi:hypothetical protein
MVIAMSDKTTMWRSRVAGWRASGQTAAVYAAEQGFTVGALRWWSSRLRREARRAAATPPIRLARVDRRVDGDTEAAMPRRGGLIIELHDVRARIAIDGRVDREALAAIVSVLREGVR